MATFEELMEQFRNPGENGVPETFADDLSKAYTDDLSIRDAAVSEREERIAAKELEIAERDKEVTRLKAVNYDLLVAAPKPGDTSENDNDNAGGQAEATGIDSLFE
jgi:hypothetical protein